jgi:uncharacterized protein
MKIHVNRVPEEGLKEHATYDPAALDMDREDIHAQEPLEVDAFATKADEELVVDVDIKAPLRMNCARCLEEFTSVLSADALFTYTVEPTDVVDITDDVRQEIMLAYPMVPVCGPGCKGLCPVCGQNRNRVDCGHQAHEAEPGPDAGGSIKL